MLSGKFRRHYTPSATQSRATPHRFGQPDRRLASTRSSARNSLLPYCGGCKPFLENSFVCSACKFKLPPAAVSLNNQGDKVWEDGNNGIRCIYCRCTGICDTGLTPEFEAVMCHVLDKPEHEVPRANILGMSDILLDLETLPPGMDGPMTCKDCYSKAMAEADQAADKDSMEIGQPKAPKPQLELEHALASMQVTQKTATADVKGFPESPKVDTESRGYRYPKQSGDFKLGAVHQEYRGRDDKPFSVKEFIKKDKRNDRVQANRMTPAVVAFKDGETEEDFGQITTIRKGADSPLITVRYDNATQWPHIRFKIFDPDMANRKSPRVVEAFVYTDSLKYSLDTKEHDSLSSLTMMFGKDVSNEDILQSCFDKENNGVSKVHSAGELWLTRVDLDSSRPSGPPKVVSPVSNSPFSLRKTPS